MKLPFEIAFDAYKRMHAEEPGSDTHAGLLAEFDDTSSAMKDKDRKMFAALRRAYLKRLP